VSLEKEDETEGDEKMQTDKLEPPCHGIRPVLGHHKFELRSRVSQREQWNVMMSLTNDTIPILIRHLCGEFQIGGWIWV
jgi:hypothetical protein